MNASFPIPYPLGVSLWYTGGPHREEWVECPECCGTKVIELVLGNGQRFSLDCRCCQSGYEDPRGVIKRTAFEYRPVPFLPLRVTIFGSEVSYSESPPEASCYSSVDSKHLFTSKEECQAKCEAMNAEHAAAEAEAIVHRRGRARKDLAWSAHYWGSQVRQLEKELAKARERLTKCKAIKKENAA